MSIVDQTPVTRFFDALSQRDFAAALATWQKDGVWHLGGQHDLVGDYVAADYIALLRQWFDTYPDYTVTAFSIANYGTEIVAAHLETENGRALDTASGLMIFRVEDGQIAEGWAIPTSLQGTQPF